MKDHPWKFNDLWGFIYEKLREKYIQKSKGAIGYVFPPSWEDYFNALRSLTHLVLETVDNKEGAKTAIDLIFEKLKEKSYIFIDTKYRYLDLNDAVENSAGLLCRIKRLKR